MDDNVLKIVCGDAPYIAGSIQVVCSKCGANVWMAPSGQKILSSSNPKAVVFCIPCGLVSIAEEAVESGEPPMLAKLGPDQLEELKDFFDEYPEFKERARRFGLID